jgi:protein gp37
VTVQFNPKTGARGIEWSSVTINVTGGCLHGCRWQMPDGTIAVCYAETVAEGIAANAYENGFADHYYRPHRLKELVRGDEPELIFADSMSDLYGSWVPEAHTIAVLEAMSRAPHHTYQLLTKAPGRLLKFVDHFPPNLWVGVSSPPDFMKGRRLSPAAQERMLARSLEALHQVKDATGNIVWMSLEPVSRDLAVLLDEQHPLDWVVIGAATNGPVKYQPDPGHVRRLLELFDATGTPVFFKGNIGPTFADNDFGGSRLNRWREDFPTRVHGRPIPAVLRRQEQAREHGWTLNTFLDDEQPGHTPVFRRDSRGEMRPALF